jgi:hypothetical protein
MGLKSGEALIGPILVVGVMSTQCGWIETDLLRAGETCWNTETRRARLNDQEAFWRAEGNTKRTSHPGSFTKSVTTVKSKHRALSGG